MNWQGKGFIICGRAGALRAIVFAFMLIYLLPSRGTGAFGFRLLAGNQALSGNLQENVVEGWLG